MKPKIHNTGEFRIVLLLALLAIFPPEPTLHAQSPAHSGNDGLLHAFAQSQGRFIENVGQYGEGVLYAASSGSQQLFFYRDSIVVLRYRDPSPIDYFRDSEQREGEGFMSRKVTHPKDRSSNAYDYEAQSLRLYPGTSTAAPVVCGPREEVVNYLISSSPSNHHKSVATWDTLRYHDIFGCYSLLFSFENGALNWDFELIDPAGDADNTFIVQLRDELLSLFQTRKSRARVKSTISTEDSRIIYSTYLGGSKPEGIRIIIPVDDYEFIFVGGTRSPDFPIVGTPWENTFRGDTGSIYATMIFVTRLNIATNQIISSTYFGGSDLDGIASAIYHNDNIVFAGSTWSDDLPVTPNAWQPQYRGNGDGYIAALNATGSELVFCSYIGGTGIENLKDMKIDAHGNIVITGLTDSWNYPTTPGVVQSSYGGGEDDIFVTKFNHDVSEMIFSTFIGGRGWDEGRSLRFTPEGNILVAGYTNSNDFPVTEDALYGNRHAYDEGCVFILSPGGRRLFIRRISPGTHMRMHGQHTSTMTV
jgi:hypothetical protein